MLFSALFAILPAIGAYASPIVARATAPTDVQVLQYALTLEHLEAAFYTQALAKFNAKAFTDAGYPGWVRGRVAQIAQHESSHVKILSAALGNQSVAACQYAFPLTDVKTFLGFATGLENIGVSAYAGANQYITDPLYRTVAATILSVEARHQGFFNGPIMLSNDWTGPYDTPLDLSFVYTLAAQLITSCPSSNAALPVKAYTPITVNGFPIANANGGQTISFTYDASKTNVAGKTVVAVIYNGLGSQVLPLTNGQVTIPAAIQGWSYLVLTTAADVASVTSDNIVAGPLELNTKFDDTVSNVGFMNPFSS